MSEDRRAVVHEDELAAIKDSRNRDMPIFSSKSKCGNLHIWIVAVSDHQAKMAMLDHVWPMVKHTKRSRDERYTELLEREYASALVPKPAVDEASAAGSPVQA